MRLIDADELFYKLKLIAFPYSNGLMSEPAVLLEDIEKAPTVDAVPVIRCRDCKYCRTYYHGDNMPFSYACDRMYLTSGLSIDDYCSRAERKEE